MPPNNLLVKDLTLLIHWKTRLSGHFGKTCKNIQKHAGASIWFEIWGIVGPGKEISIFSGNFTKQFQFFSGKKGSSPRIDAPDLPYRYIHITLSVNHLALVNQSTTPHDFSFHWLGQSTIVDL